MQLKCTIQYAGYEFDRFDEMGNLSFDQFLKLYDEFPWVEQWQKGKIVTTGCAATLAIEDKEEVLWVSIFTVNKEPAFLLGYMYPKMVKRWWYWGKMQTTKWVDIYEANSIEIKYCYQFFFAGNRECLKSELLTLKFYDSMRASDL